LLLVEVLLDSSSRKTATFCCRMFVCLMCRVRKRRRRRRESEQQLKGSNNQIERK